MRRRFFVAAVFSIPVLLWSPIGRDVLGFTVAAPFGLRDDVWSLLLSLPVIVYADSIFFDGAYRALRARTLDMMVLVAVAVGAGWLYSVVVTLTGGGDVFYEAATVLSAFVLLGHWFEMRARGGANDAIRTLLDLAPPMAVVVRDGEAVEIPTAEVVVGDLLLIRPGAKIPVDATRRGGRQRGRRVDGHRREPAGAQGARLRSRRRDDQRERRPPRPSHQGRQRHRAGADRQARPGGPELEGARPAARRPGRLLARARRLIGGGATLAAWLLFSDRPASDAVLFAITVVVITCPDALGLATPTAIMVGTGLGAKRGVLFKNAAAIETSARIEVVVMDKTGTLTKGEPEVTDVIVDGLEEREVLAFVAAVERESEHPLAEAVVRYAADREVPSRPAEGFENVPGQGAVAQVDGRRVAVGNLRLMEREGVELGSLADRRRELADDGRTAVLVALDGRAVAVIGIADAVRPSSAAAVEALHDLGVEVVMLTGDNEATARRIASQLGIDTVIAEVLPGDKSAQVAELQQAGRRGGDGGRRRERRPGPGSGRPRHRHRRRHRRRHRNRRRRADALRSLDVPTALRIGRGTLRKMRQNLGWAIGYNAIALPIAAGVFEPAFGLVLRPEIAALSMSGSSFIVAVNAVMLKRLRLPAPVGADPNQGPSLSRPALEAVHG